MLRKKVVAVCMSLLMIVTLATASVATPVIAETAGYMYECYGMPDEDARFASVLRHVPFLIHLHTLQDRLEADGNCCHTHPITMDEYYFRPDSEHYSLAKLFEICPQDSVRVFNIGTDYRFYVREILDADTSYFNALLNGSYMPIEALSSCCPGSSGWVDMHVWHTIRTHPLPMICFGITISRIFTCFGCSRWVETIENLSCRGVSTGCPVL